MSQTPDQIIRSFCEAWSQGDLDEIMVHFDESAIYHNIPMEIQEGLENIRGFIEGFLTMASSIEFDILHQVTEGDVVMNERVDTLVMGENTIALPVMGIFELENGKIVKWRDYFDMGQLTGQQQS
ncbi:MAG: limonene-1,2-epoxide hydrolase [Acidimicrobiaceae bacterium]|nr:limonene-1,2-epoxide hydrolase [Acidimicrobiaceae bacterium]